MSSLVIPSKTVMSKTQRADGAVVAITLQDFDGRVLAILAEAEPGSALSPSAVVAGIRRSYENAVAGQPIPLPPHNHSIALHELLSVMGEDQRTVAIEAINAYADMRAASALMVAEEATSML